MIWYGMVWYGIVWYGMVWYSDLYLKTGWPIQLRSCYPEGPCVFITNYNNNKKINMCGNNYNELLITSFKRLQYYI